MALSGGISESKNAVTLFKRGLLGPISETIMFASKLQLNEPNSADWTHTEYYFPGAN